MAPGPTFAATSGLLPRGDLAGRRHYLPRAPNPVPQSRASSHVTTSGDGWVRCRAGHRHWGRFGAAGLLVHSGDRVILQHRAPWTHEGGTWGVPGGARNSDEDAIAAAVREAGEEAGLARADIDPIGVYVDDHGGWSYQTVVARPVRALQPVATNAESVAVSWHQVDQVANLALHNGFAAAWHRLREAPEPLHLLVAAELRDHPLIGRLSREGIPATRLPLATPFDRLYPHPVPVPEAADFAPMAAAYALGGSVLTVREPAELLALLDTADCG
jgi:8-oxo-dGTP diphosphatase